MSTYKKRFYRATATVLIGTVGITGLAASTAAAGPVVSVASTAAAPSVLVSTVAGSSAVAVAPVTNPAPVAPANGTGAVQAEKRIPIGPIVNFLKRVGSAIWNAAVKAVKAGYNAFLKWWNSLASWVRAGIRAITGASVYEIWSALWNYLF